MRAYHELPADFRQILEVDLQKNKKLMLLVNVLALVIAAVMVVCAHFYIPLSALFSMEAGMTAYFLRFGVLILCVVLYMILHELVHGIAMKLCGTPKVRYGFTGMYAFVGSDDYYPLGSYIFIALAPVVLWGIVLAALHFLVPTEWFWVTWFLQIVNISGAAGDFYVTCRFLRLPKDILVRDHGTGMKVYATNREGAER